MWHIWWNRLLCRLLCRTVYVLSTEECQSQLSFWKNVLITSFTPVIPRSARSSMRLLQRTSRRLLWNLVGKGRAVYFFVSLVLVKCRRRLSGIMLLSLWDRMTHGTCRWPGIRWPLWPWSLTFHCTSSLYVTFKRCRILREFEGCTSTCLLHLVYLLCESGSVQCSNCRFGGFDPLAHLNDP